MTGQGGTVASFHRAKVRAAHNTLVRPCQGWDEILPLLVTQVDG
ncbi:MAG TPA: hypothetical protein VEQ11_11210 [Chloroflexota bacterium]|nr:hypothetical protein [Chloroflexota bacterium]